MSNEPGNFKIEYQAGDRLIASEAFFGPISKAEHRAILGLIRHLFSGVDQARIVDVAGVEVKVIRPIPPADPGEAEGQTT